MSHLKELFASKNNNILSIYFTAGYPKLEDTKKIIQSLSNTAVDLIEIGIPFSDPVADGETIQQSSQKALLNGMNLNLLFEQLKNIREVSSMPLILMGYLNPIMQYGVDDFCKKCKELKIDGTIIPDLPLELYLKDYRAKFNACGLSNISLITPQTSDQRIKFIDDNSDSFIYAVSSAAVTGGSIALEERSEYLKHIQSLKLKNPILVGFGVSTKADFTEISKYTNGAIIGSAFIREIGKASNLEESIKSFIQKIRA